MARGKKKGTLTPEERLQAALVPESEQPYKIPGNWCWVRLPDSFYNCTDSKKKIPQKEYMKEGNIAVVDQGQDLVGGYTNDREKVFTGDLPVIIFGDHTRCIKYIDFPFAQGADGVKVLKPKPFFDARAFYYAFQNVNIPNMGYRRHFPLFDQYAIPLPPFPEQQRIVDRIESLFAKLEEAKQKAQAALDSFEPRKAAILHKAFTGELTAQWRAEHGFEKATWIGEKLKNCITLLSGQDFPSNKYNSEEKGIPYITGASNFENNHVCINRWTEEPSVVAHKGDVLLVCKGSGYGKTIIADFEYAHIARQIMSLRVTGTLSNQFLLYYLQSNIRYIRESGQGLIPGISRRIVLDMEIPLPSIDEQTEIVRILDHLLAKEQQAKAAAEGVLEQIDLIKKSILARAFRGELGTNDPSEARAVELLKQVL